MATPRAINVGGAYVYKDKQSGFYRIAVMDWQRVYNYLEETKQLTITPPFEQGQIRDAGFTPTLSLSNWMRQFSTLSNPAYLAAPPPGRSREDTMAYGWLVTGDPQGIGNAFIGVPVYKPNGEPAKLLSSDAINDPLKRFDVFQAEVKPHGTVTFQIFNKAQYDLLRRRLAEHTTNWKKNLGEGRRFNDGAWTEPDADLAMGIERRTARQRAEEAADEAEAKSPPRPDAATAKLLRNINVQNVLLSQMNFIAQASGVTFKKSKPKYLSCYKGRPDALIGLVSNSPEVAPFVNATTDMLGSLSPHIRLFYTTRFADGREVDEEINFSDHVKGEKVVELAKARRNNEVKVLEGRDTQGTNVGIKSFEWVYEDKHFGENVLIANLSIYFASIADLANSDYHEFLFLTGDRSARDVAGFPTSKKGETRKEVKKLMGEIEAEVKFRKNKMKKPTLPRNKNTFIKEYKSDGTKSKTGVGKAYRELKAIVGWSVPTRPSGRQLQEGFTEAVAATQKLIKLNLMHFQLDFGQEGQATLNMQFAGSIGKFLSDQEKTDVLGITKERKQYGTIDVAIPVLLNGDRILGTPETSLPGGYITSLVELQVGKTVFEKYKTYGTEGNLGGLSRESVTLNLAGVIYEMETLRKERIVLLDKQRSEKNSALREKLRKQLELNDTYIKTCLEVQNMIDGLYRKAKYASFVERMLKEKKMFYATIRKGNDEKFEFVVTGNGTAATKEETTKKKMKGAASKSKPVKSKPTSSATVIDPDKPFEGFERTEVPGQINVYYMRLGDILDTAFTHCRLYGRKDIGVLLGSFSPNLLGVTAVSGKKYYSLADIPISLEAYGDWFNKHIASQGINKISFRRFVQLLLNDLVTPIINGMSADNKQENRFGFTVTPIQTTVRFKEGYMYSEGQLMAKMKLDTASPGTPVNQYLVIGCSQQASGNGSYSEDISKGIFHLVLGSDRGLVKSFSFTEMQNPYLRAMNISNAHWNNALVLPQDCEVTMYGNNLFKNGQMVYINADLGFGTAVADRLGLGGYYRVVRSQHSIGPSGYETTIRCFWEYKP